MTKGKSDYCDSLKKKVFNDWNEVYKCKTTQEIDNVPKTEKGMRHSTPKTVKKISSRWNGKDLASIEADKNKLLGWCEKDIIREDTVKKTRDINSEDETDSSSIQIRIKSKPITLGDFIPNARTQPLPKNDLSNSENDLQQNIDLMLQSSIRLSENKEKSDIEILL